MEQEEEMIRVQCVWYHMDALSSGLLCWGKMTNMLFSLRQSERKLLWSTRNFFNMLDHSKMGHWDLRIRHIDHKKRGKARKEALMDQILSMNV